ncbi:MAG: TIGR00269 family protein [Nanoarchaeota archaeon]
MSIEGQIKKTIKEYELIKKQDRLIVALSGGKDSTSILYLLKKLGYDVNALMINLNFGEWSKLNLINMENFCKSINVNLDVINLNEVCRIEEIVEKSHLTKCTVCGVVKKWALNKWAKKLRADKIVTGHNLDDECQTIIMNFLKGNIYLGINSTPLTGVSNANFVQRIKPLFFTPEDEIKKYAEKMHFPVVYERCPYASKSYRIETREWLKDFSDNQKLKIVKNYQKIIPELRKRSKDEIINCEICGEASKNKICRACSFLNCSKIMTTQKK